MWKYDSCIKCFEPLNGQDICPCCRYKQSAYQPPKYALTPFSVLATRYLVGAVVGHGGFGVTYAAQDTWNNRRCAIKEYLPSEWAYRDEQTGEIRPKTDSKSQYVFNTGREKYIKEAESLWQCKNNPIVVTIQEYFKENNTGYIVMEFLDGQDLEQMAKSRNGRLDVDFVMNALMIVGTALAEIHKKGILHRDVKPQNIFYTRDGEFKLLDFGSARDYVRAEKMQQGLSVLLTKGYAPPEQYSKNTMQGAYTDVYALCATVYKLISGNTPKDGIDRARGSTQPSLYELKLGVSEKLSRVIEKGLAPEIKDRYRNFSELFDDLGKEQEEAERKKWEEAEQNRKGQEAQKWRWGKRDTREQKKREEEEQNRRGREEEERKKREREEREKREREEEERKKGEKEEQKKRAYVKVLSGSRKGSRAEIPVGEEITIGRSSDCQLVVGGDTAVSRQHCVVAYDKNEGLYLKDLSTYGTYGSNRVRFLRGQYRPLKPGEIFYLANPGNQLQVYIEK